MIDLRTKLSNNTFSKPTMLLDNDSKLLTEKEIDSIIKWCSRNGYPFEIPYKELEKTYKESEKPRKYELFKKILRDQKRFGFKVSDFLISLNNLYCPYYFYCKAVGTIALQRLLCITLYYDKEHTTDDVEEFLKSKYITSDSNIDYDSSCTERILKDFTKWCTGKNTNNFTELSRSYCQMYNTTVLFNTVLENMVMP